MVSEDHLIVEQRVTNATNDNYLLQPAAAPGGRRGAAHRRAAATLECLAQRGIDAYVPDSNLAHELNSGRRARKMGRDLHPEHRRMRKKWGADRARALCPAERIIEPVFGILKEQRRMRGLAKVEIEMALACTAYNLTRLWRVQTQAR